MTNKNYNPPVEEEDYVHETHPTAFTSHMCETCGSELRLFEYQQYETTCSSCIKEETMYINEDDPYKEL